MNPKAEQKVIRRYKKRNRVQGRFSNEAENIGNKKQGLILEQEVEMEVMLKPPFKLEVVENKRERDTETDSDTKLKAKSRPKPAEMTPMLKLGLELKPKLKATPILPPKTKLKRNRGLNKLLN